MWIDGHRDFGHLTYCTNIHAGEDWPDVIGSLRTHVPAIKTALSPSGDFGIGLRIGGAAAEALKTAANMEELQSFLADSGCTVVTFNGFPFGAFHGQKVKEDVYSPDWSTDVRLAYTNALADFMVALLPDDEAGSISTVPGTFKEWVPGRVEPIVANLIDHVAYLVDTKQRTGKMIALALEPEPCCMLETIAESVTFFEEHIFAPTGIDRLMRQTGLSRADADAAMHAHIGLCYDVCHAAVEYEDPKQSLEDLRSAAIAIPKLQLSSALRILNVDDAKLAELKEFDEPVYLHQVIQSDSRGLSRFKDLPDAFAKAEAAMGSEWRVHFHVPIFLERLEKFDTTQSFLRDILALHRSDPISPHLEVETYTWDVLPAEYRNVPVSEAIAREMAWVRDQLTQ
ncbi:MAG: metabolite traffic protein EboE [Hyphomicrobiaceae bacterium]